MNTKNPISNHYHNHTRKQMLALLPFEIVDHVVGYLDFGDVRSIACVCSALRLPGQVRLFRTINIGFYPSRSYPCRTESIISSLHLLQYASCLMVGPNTPTPMEAFWPCLPVMYRLKTMHIYFEPIPNSCSRALSALESLGSAREIALICNGDLAPDMLMSDNPLPVHSLELSVDASNHQVVKRLIQKCSQSLRQLHLCLQDNIDPPSTFLPHIYEFSAKTYLDDPAKTPDLMSWFPFLNQHPTITRLSLGPQFTLTVQPSPNLLPNLQFLSATPAIIERLIPGRAVDDIYVIYRSPLECHFPVDIMLRSLRQPFVPVTTVAIDTSFTLLLDNFLINLVQALPKLRKFILDWACNEVRQLLEAECI